ncbi:MAG: galactosamine-6-phosphate isomerase [Chlorobi bacterium]|nr:galactosamine-6-phosphate isomerase [Chlorobiota bacterium]
MKIEILDNYDELSNKAKDILVQEIRKNKRLLLCAATGGSPAGMYFQIAVEYQKQRGLFSQIRVIKLDEWGGLSMDEPATCEAYLQEHLVKPLEIPTSRYTGFQSNPDDPEQECRRIQSFLQTDGPVDVCILGLGMNGHLALNEPADFLHPYCHVNTLTDMSLGHSMLSGLKKKPAYGLTLGMADILHARKIIFLVSGKKKRQVFEQFLTKKITTFLPASLLWLHPDVTCLADREVAGNMDIPDLSVP